MQDRIDVGMPGERAVGMPVLAGIGDANRLAVLDDVRQHDDLGIALKQELVEHMPFERAERPAEGDVLGRRERLVAQTDQAVRVESRAVQYQTPALGYLTVLTRYETCNVRVGQRDLGYPPITRLPLVAGQHRIDIVCPAGQNPQGQLVTVAPNENATARIF